LNANHQKLFNDYFHCLGEIVAQNWAMYMAREGKAKEFWDQFKLLLDAYDMDEDPNAEREKDRLVQILAPYTAGLSQAFPLSKEQQTLWVRLITVLPTL
jgi:hypothetical protein